MTEPNQGFTADRTVSAHAETAAEAAEAFALLTDTAAVPRWNAMHAGFRDKLPARFAVGLEFTEQISIMGIPADIAWHVQHCSFEQGLSMRGVGPLDLELELGLSVEPHGERCAIVLTAGLAGDPLRGPMGASIAASVHEALEQSVTAFADLLAGGERAAVVDPLSQPVTHQVTGTVLDPRTPVIVGVGQLVQREPQAPYRHPAQLSADALRAALADSTAGDALSGFVDAVYAVASASWTYRDQARAVADELGLEVDTTVVSARFGGDAGQNLVNEAAAALQAGEHTAVLISGAEVGQSLSQAQRDGITPDWPAQSAELSPDRVVGSDAPGNNAAESEVGLGVPIYIYSMIESALAGEAGRTPAEQQQHAGELWSRLSQAAQDNPYAWMPQSFTAAELTTPSELNRAVAGAYTKLLCANLTVDLASGLVLCTAAAAQAAGVPQDKWVFVHVGAAGNDEWFVSNRAALTESPAIRTLGEAALAHVQRPIDQIEHLDLYSCFPSAVQIAVKELGVDPAASVSVTGGLTFAGGPGNNYGGHGVAAMVQRLREHPTAFGLTTSLGWYLTKHALGIYSMVPPTRPYVALKPVIGPFASRPVLTSYSGDGVIEACTVPFARDGAGEAAIISVLTPDGARVLVRSSEPEVMRRCETENLSGVEVTVVRSGAGGSVELKASRVALPAAPEPTVLVEDRGPVRIITLNRPERRNAIDLATAELLEKVIDAFEADPRARVAILTGAGESFCAGMDLKAAAAGQFAMTAKRGALGIAALPIIKPVIAAVEGHALAGGCELALVADLIVASTTSQFGIPEPKRGLVAAAGGVLRLSQRLPRNVAMELALTGNPMPATRMAELGLVNRLAEPGQVLDAALALADEIVVNAPISIEASKQIVVESPDWPIAEQMDRQTDLASRAIFSEDATEGVLAFAEKRDAQWKGR